MPEIHDIDGDGKRGDHCAPYRLSVVSPSISAATMSPLPFSSTFTGHLDEAEALYDGSNRNLIGVRNFVSGTPQLAVLLGMTLRSLRLRLSK